MVTLTIRDLKDGPVLAVDLRDLLRLLAPLSLSARWTITSPDVEDFWATGEGGLRLEELADTPTQIGGSELLAIADDTQQVIWGDFAGTFPDNVRSVWITIRAVDSSYYEVVTTDQTSIAKIKAHFSDVRVEDGDD